MKRIFLMLMCMFLLSVFSVGCMGLRAPGDLSIKDKVGWYKGKVKDAKLVSTRIKEVKVTIGIMKRWPNDHSVWTPEQLKQYDLLLVKIEWLVRARLSLSEKDVVKEILEDKDVTSWLEDKGVNKVIAGLRPIGEGKEPTIVRM